MLGRGVGAEQAEEELDGGAVVGVAVVRTRALSQRPYVPLGVRTATKQLLQL